MEDPRRHIRQFQDEDEAATAAVWHRAGLAAYPYLPTWQAFTLEHARRVFHDVIRANCAIWVGTLDAQIVAYLAMNGSYLDRLYVDPGEWCRGWGTRFIALANSPLPMSPPATKQSPLRRSSSPSPWRVPTQGLPD
jgi:hypothetical protein